MEDTAEAAWREFVRGIQQGRRPPFSAHWKAFREAYPGDPVPVAWWPDPETRGSSNLLSLLDELGFARRRSVTGKQLEHAPAQSPRQALDAKTLESLFTKVFGDGFGFAGPTVPSLAALQRVGFER